MFSVHSPTKTTTTPSMWWARRDVVVICSTADRPAVWTSLTPSRCWVATQALPPCTRRRTRSVWGPTPSRPPWNTLTWTTTTVDSWNLPANWAKIWQWNVLVSNLTQMRKGMNKRRQLLISQLTFNQVERRNICWKWYHSWFTTSMFWILAHTRVKGFRQKFKVQFKECVGKNDRVRVNWKSAIYFVTVQNSQWNLHCVLQAWKKHFGSGS